MDAKKLRNCPVCGYFLVDTERQVFDSGGNSRFEPMLICPSCGWKKRIQETGLFDHHL
jgi:RNase P subunit RPR2